MQFPDPDPVDRRPEMGVAGQKVHAGGPGGLEMILDLKRKSRRSCYLKIRNCLIDVVLFGGDDNQLIGDDATVFPSLGELGGELLGPKMCAPRFLRCTHFGDYRGKNEVILGKTPPQLPTLPFFGERWKPP